jgi:cation:H+ antiporter
MSDIFGGNAFLPVLFLVASLLSGSAVLPHAQDTDVYLTALGALLTVVYLVGLISRPTRRITRMGADSLAVLVLYALGTRRARTELASAEHRGDAGLDGGAAAAE